jgi:cell division transport system ATP-binding protein
MIELDNVTVRYPNGAEALRNVSAAVDPGEFVFIIGPNGSGKSTFLKLLYREEVATQGKVYVAGRDVRILRPSEVPFFRRSIGVIFQDYRLLKYKTVEENVAFALHVTGARLRDVRERVPQTLKLVGLLDKARCFPDQLSGGEQQRVSIARALVNAPSLLLADEPTGNLDPTASRGIFSLLETIHRAGTTVIVATHDAPTVDRMQKRVLTFHEGRIVADRATAGYHAAQESFFRTIEEFPAEPLAAAPAQSEN